MLTIMALRQLWIRPLARLGWLSMVPPLKRDFVGGVDFVAHGKQFLGYFIELCHLSRDAKVLDVGCGIGRMAIPLTQYLSPKGQYKGFDIVPLGIAWCQERINPRFPNFCFKLADIRNAAYNPAGKYMPTEFHFPYEENAFDFVFLTSVFTHMLPQDVEHYLSEIARVLKPHGQCFITYFLLNEESTALIASGASTLDFCHEMPGCLTINKDCPEYAVAYDEQLIRTYYNKYRLTIQEPVRYGSWPGRIQHYAYQDIIVGTKEGALGELDTPSRSLRQ